MRFRIPELFLGCLFTVAVFSVGMLLTQGTWLTKDAGGFFTFALVIVGVLQAALFLVQLKLIRESLGPAKEAARAAQAAAEALPTVERAYVFMVPALTFGTSVPHSSGVGERYNRISVQFRIENLGKTPAAIESVYVRLGVLPDPPDNRTHLISNIVAGEAIVRSDDAWIPAEINPIICNISESEFDDISNNRAAIWFYGSILYKDMFGGERTTRFRWCYSELLEVFTPRGEAPFNERA
jgi:hypothetical protein